MGAEDTGVILAGAGPPYGLVPQYVHTVAVSDSGIAHLLHILINTVHPFQSDVITHHVFIKLYTILSTMSIFSFAFTNRLSHAYT